MSGGKSLNNKMSNLERKETSLMQYLLAYQTKSQMHLIRKLIVLYAMKHGNQSVADKYECHRNTVSKFVNRFKKEGEEALKDRSRAPHHIPHKIVDPAVIDDICKKRDQTGYGSNRLKIQFDLEQSNMAINRIYHENDKIDEPKKKWQQKQDLWYIKRFF